MAATLKIRLRTVEWYFTCGEAARAAAGRATNAEIKRLAADAVARSGVALQDEFILAIV